MKNSEFLLIGAGFLILSGICIILIQKGFNFAISKVNWSKEEKLKFTNREKLTMGGWLIFVSMASLSGFFADFNSFPPPMVLGLLPPFVFIIYITFFSKRLGAILAVIPQQWIIYLQTFRIPVELLLWAAFLNGITPIQMTLEGRNWDILSGILALPVGYIASKSGNKLLIILYNLIGFSLLVNIVAISILSTPTPFRIFMNEPANTAVVYFPMVLLPCFLVPLGYTLHFWSIRKLFSKTKAPATILA